MLLGELTDLVADEDQLRSVRSNPETRERFMGQLAERGYAGDVIVIVIEEIKVLVDAPSSDFFDVLSYVLFTLQPLTRNERAAKVKQDGLENVTEDMRKFLRRILESYVKNGESELATDRLSQYMMAAYGSIGEGKGCSVGRQISDLLT